MKILFLNCVCGSGSTGRLISALYDYSIDQGNEPFILYGIGKKEEDSHKIKVVPSIVRKIQSLRARITGYPYGGNLWGTIVTLKHLNNIQPDIVHVHCINGYTMNIYRVLNYLKTNRIPTVITNHAEFMFTGGCTHAVECDKWLSGCYSCEHIGETHPISYFFDNTKKEWEKMRRAYSGFEKLQICCVSEWASSRARKSPMISDFPICTVLNGVNTKDFCYIENMDIRGEYGFNEKKVVLHVTPNFHDPLKGGKHVLEMAKRFPEVSFLIVGADSPNDLLPNCKFVGRITDSKKLAELYSMADVCLLTSVRETFSMVCAESLCCGTPVVGFNAGGPESIALKEYSRFVEQGNDDELEKVLKMSLNSCVDKKEVSREAIEKYGQLVMCKKYQELYENFFSSQI